MSLPQALRASPPRLVATDLDGTLIRSDGVVSPYTAEVLAELDRRDVPVVFVTGRPLRWAREVFEYVGSHGLAIVTNGAMVWDVAAEAPRLQHWIPSEVAADVTRLLRGAMPDVTFSVETVDGWATEIDRPHNARFAPFREAPLAEIVQLPLLKVLARREGANPDEFVARATELVGDIVEVTHSSFPLLEISAKGITKASTLSQLCTDLGIAADEVVAFGDMPNDLPMLGWAGASYAMANAHDDVLACATNVAPGHDEDGVARVLARLFDL